MSAEVYEVIAQAMRYWFLFLMALIVWRSYRWYRRDRKERKKRLRLLPDAGYVGELVVTDGGGVLKEGEAMPVPREGTLGFTRINDLCVPVDGVKNKHLWFCFDDDDGLKIEPYSKNKAEIDGEAFVSRRNPLYMAHGSRLRVGEAELRLRLFAGFETYTRAPAQDFSDEREQGGEAAAYGAGMGYAYPPLTPEQLMMNQHMWAQWQAAWMAAQAQQGMYQAAQGAYPQAAQPVLSPEQYGAMTAWLASQQGYGGDGNTASGEGAVGGATGAFASYQAYREWAERERAGRETSDAVGCDAAEYDDEGFDDEADYNTGLSGAGAQVGEEYTPASNQTVLAPAEGFYPPEGLDDVEAWAYAPYPDFDTEDDDLTDAMQPPRSAYIGDDEAELAKKKVWDRYLGRGRRR